MLRNIRENLFMLMQRALPARLLGRAIYAVTRSEAPAVKDLLIRGFVRLYGVDTTEAEKPVPQGYPSFNAFFTRRLKAGARPVDPDPKSIVSPADGVIQQIGRMQGDEILQVKGMGYSAAELLGDSAVAQRFNDGNFVTIYLAPWNYHRVHVPVTGHIRSMTHVPGELWSVNATTAARVPRLFARNERVVCLGETPWGSFAVVLVGALNVGSISTAWGGEVLPHPRGQQRHWAYAASDRATLLERGAILGQFNMGSTVIVLFPPGVARWRTGLTAGGLVTTNEALGWLDAGAGDA